MDTVMTGRQSSGLNVSARSRAWEPPALIELKIGAETKSNRDGGRARQVPAPPPPAAPMTKLGFSFEWAFPLSSRIEK